MNDIYEKQCKVCKKKKFTIDFGVDSRTKDGYSTTCDVCLKLLTKKRKTSPEKTLKPIKKNENLKNNSKFKSPIDKPRNNSNNIQNNIQNNNQNNIIQLPNMRLDRNRNIPQPGNFNINNINPSNIPLMRNIINYNENRNNFEDLPDSIRNARLGIGEIEIEDSNKTVKKTSKKETNKQKDKGKNKSKVDEPKQLQNKQTSTERLRDAVKNRFYKKQVDNFININKI